MKRSAKPKATHRRASRSSRIHKWIALRIRFVAVLATVAMFGLAVQSWALQVDRSTALREQAERQHLRNVELAAARGNVYDATGSELAANADVESVFASPGDVVDVAATAETLAELLNIDIRAVEARLASPKYFAWVARHVTPQQATAVRAKKLPGIRLTRESRRFYPSQGLAAPVLGYVDVDSKGVEGIELTLDGLLTGKHTTRASVRDANGRLLAADANGEPETGAAVHLTLHRPLQFSAERAIRVAIEEHQAASGCAIVLDVKTGDVLALANWPTFDSNMPGTRTQHNARNSAVTEAYEIGSVMKVFTVAAALEHGAVRPSSMVNTGWGRLRIGRKLITDTHHDKELSVADVLKRSSNVGAVRIARRLGGQALHQTLVDLGFGNTTGIELPGEQRGLLDSHKNWRAMDLAALSYGYRMSATPLQVAAAMAAIGSEGVYHAPRIVKKVQAADGEALYVRGDTAKRVLSTATAAQMRSMLESVFDRGELPGTAKDLEVRGFRVGGKTGTAHKYNPTDGGYYADRYLSSFAGLAPIDDPAIAVVVVIDDPQGDSHFGAQVAGPAWVQIVSEALPYLGVPMQPKKSEQNNGSTVEDDAIGAPLGDTLHLGGVPDFRGLGIAKALSVARRHHLNIDVAGSGRAIHQVPARGQSATDKTVRVVFAPTH